MTASTPIPDGSVIITPTEVYRELRATHDAVRDVAAKLDGIAQDIGDHTETIEDHETRIRALERTALKEDDVTSLRADVESLKHARWPLPSIAAVTGLAALGITVWTASGR
ncbi:hypothetical protein [Yinghuangia soli]|uniref:Uncharacterized protein n=1 Tax=Yinghuangia soli TaxID=2908204 RepID=A0AA41Q7T4_9ACTN|nr:hypothetical protein [Yinghuangia soli]MCF2531762.1 hypothetical protein [Yinghuangia soli]